jgi:DNA polymerase-3 subunit alpha
MALFGWAMESESEWTIQQRVQAQEEILGVGVDAHPLELVADRISAAGAVSTVDAIGMSGQRIRVAGLKQSSHRSQTSRGETMMFLTLEDLEGLLDVVFFPDVYRRYSSLLSGGKPVLVSGVMDMDKDRGESVLKAERVDRLS